MRAAREAWFEGQLDLDPDRLLLIDDTAANTSLARRYGRAPRGERCLMSVPQSRWKTTTVTAGLRAGGITASWLLDGTMNGQASRTDVADVLAPTLQSGDTVVMDNLPAHKVSGIRERIEAMGGQAPLTPGPQPRLRAGRIGLCQAEGSAKRCGGGDHLRLSGAIGRSLNRFTPAACRAYPTAAGYDAT